MNGFISSSVPTPNYKRLMTFIDGENLVFQYQNLLNKGKSPNETVKHLEDVYAWSINAMYNLQYAEIIRATYYTSATGSDELLNTISSEIKRLKFKQGSYSALPDNLQSYVIKKAKKEKKSKGVDIKMVVDILSNVYQNNTDIVYILSGDGDFLPVIKECQRNGKVIFLGAFEAGLNKSLLNYIDRFIPLETCFFN